VILTGPEIRRQLEKGEIKIDPFIEAHLNPASIDLTLGGNFFEYDNPRDEEGVLDARAEQKGKITRYDPGDPVVLFPGKLYLAHTMERVCTRRLVPVIDGKSSIGRLGVSVHQTAGYGDAGYDGQYTLEVTVVYPTRLYVGMRIAQMRFHVSVGDLALYNGRYVGDAAVGPVPARQEVPPRALLAPAQPKPANGKQVGKGSLVKCRFKAGTGKSERVVNGEGVVIELDDRTLRIRVWGGTAAPDPVIEVARASDDWSLRYP